MATGGNIVSCRKQYPMTQKKCRSAQCKGVANGLRLLVEDYKLKLVVYDLKTNDKMLITAYKKNIEDHANNAVPRTFGGGQAEHVRAKLGHLMAHDKCFKITYWLKVPTENQEGTEVRLEGRDPIPVFIDCEQVMDEDPATDEEKEMDTAE